MGGETYVSKLREFIAKNREDSSFIKVPRIPKYKGVTAEEPTELLGLGDYSTKKN